MTATQTSQADLRITGMHCESCSILIEEVLSELDGVTSASVDLPGGTATVEYRPEAVDLGRITAAIADVGYTATEAG